MSIQKICNEVIEASKNEWFARCEECGDHAVARYDSQGEGYYFLCGKKDYEHGIDAYAGILIGNITNNQAPKLAKALLVMQKANDKIIDACQCETDDRDVCFEIAVSARAEAEKLLGAE